VSAVTTEVQRRTLPAELGDALLGARLDRGWSARHAADVIGISHTMLIRLERGERCPSTRVACALVFVLGLSDRVADSLMSVAVRRGPDGGCCGESALAAGCQPARVRAWARAVRAGGFSRHEAR